VKRLLLTLLFLSLFSAPARAGHSFSFSQETLLAPLNKQVEKYDETGKLIAGFGRETTEFAGISGFSDLSPNWRVLYGLSAALTGYPLFKASSSLAFMINTPYPLPLRPYVFLGLDPVFSADPALTPLSLTSHAGLGLEYSWNNSLHLSFDLRYYLLNPFQAQETSTKNLIWPAGSFSLGMQAGLLF